MGWSGDFGFISEVSRTGSEELSIEWWLKDFLFLAGSEDHYWSPEFRIGDERFCFRLCPTWDRQQTRAPASGFVRLVLVRFDLGPPKNFRFSLAIKGSGGLEKYREGVKEFSGFDHCSWDHFCSRSSLIKHRARLMPHGALYIACVLKRAGPAGVATNDAEGENDDSDSEESEDEADDKASKNGKFSRQQNQEENSRKRFETLVRDLGKLLSGGENSDVTVQVGDAEFQVHRNILCARSPVLAAMFKQETAEKTTDKITVRDCAPDVFREYLQYLYTGSVGLLSEQNVFHLYAVADKYLADELKEQCLMHIQDILSVRTFCDTVKLALTHGDSGLLEQATDFATENIRSIISTVEWQNLIREYPAEANEVLIKSFGPPSRKSKH